MALAVTHAAILNVYVLTQSHLRTLRLASLVILVDSKIVLGLLLAVGPAFLLLLLFDATRGLFEGWTRAALAFALAPLAVTLLLGLALAMIDPALSALADTIARKQ